MTARFTFFRNIVSLCGFLCVFLGGAVALSGCGGGGGGGETTNFTNIKTGQNGSLANVQIGPTAGSTYISRATIFQVSWPDATPPPSEFGIALRRYKEARGGESKSVEAQAIDVNRQSNSFSWNVSRRGLDLDSEGVYFLELNSPGSSNGRAAFIVDNKRSRFTPSPAPSKTRYFDTGGNGGNLGGIQILPAPGTVSIPRSTIWRISWPAGQQPPPQLNMEIVRYKEPRGDAGLDVSTQDHDLKNVTDVPFAYDLKLKDNKPLDSEGVYFLEITAPGSNGVPTTYRAAYIVDSN